MSKSRRIQVGAIEIGGGAPVAVQSMTKTPTENPRAVIAQTKRLVKCGCEIIRVAVPNRKAVAAFKEIRAGIRIPLIADIHFSADLAIASLELGADAVRVNPGNLGGAAEFKRVAKFARDKGRAIRIGVNSGSLEKSLAKRKGLDESEKLVISALRCVEIADRIKLSNVKVSLKSHDVPSTVAAYRAFARQCDAPLHVGVTEAGDVFSGAIKSAVGLGILLSEGIGDTIRVSLTGPPEREVEAAWEILKALNLRRRGLEVVSCPTCGRCGADVEAMVARLKKTTAGMTVPLRVAVMGCEVNGPGEAAAADVGIALNRTGGGMIFKNGKPLRKVPRESALDTLLKLIGDEIEHRLPRKA